MCFLFTCVCMYVSMYVCMYACMYECMYVCIKQPVEQVRRLEHDIMELEDGLELTKCSYAEVNRLLQQQLHAVEADLVAAKVECDKLKAERARLEFMSSYQLATDSGTSADPTWSTAGDGAAAQSQTAAALLSPRRASVSVELQGKYDKAKRQVQKLSEVLADMEAKYVEAKLQVVNLTDAVNSLEDERAQLMRNIEGLTTKQISMQSELVMYQRGRKF
jgi:hypothetical protein